MDTIREETEDVLIQQQAHILKELARLNGLVQRLTEKGLVTAQDQAHVELTLEVSELESKIKILEAAGRDVTDLHNQLRATQYELEIVDKAS